MSPRRAALSALLIVACSGCVLSAQDPGAPPGVPPQPEAASSPADDQPVASSATDQRAAYFEAAYGEVVYQEAAEPAVPPPAPDAQSFLIEEVADPTLVSRDAAIQETDQDLAPVPGDGQVDINYFYRNLIRYGHWVLLSAYGWVWLPNDVPTGWRPYTLGHWALTDYGWTWISSERFGWATYHYGRWLLDPQYGWIWVPDYEWGPAWVAWCEGGGYIGWAPLPPAGRGAGAPTGAAPDPATFCLVEERSFLDPQVASLIVPPSSALPILRNTAPIGTK